jgi:hypothetical protein
LTQALALGVVLRVELRGWKGPPPALPKPPLRDEAGADEARVLVYDFTSADPQLSVEEAALSLASRLRRLLMPERSPFAEPHLAAKLVLEFGILADASRDRFSYSWPLEFLDALVECDIELNVSHYLPRSEADGPTGL